MKETEFREWLEQNGANTENGRNTRIYAVSTIEAGLKKLGFDYPDLESAWQASRFEDLRQALTGLRNDFDAGGDNFKILMPHSEKPRNRLINYRNWLGQYGRFLAGEGISSGDADRIRHYVLEHYIEPARENDDANVEFVVRDVNDALGLNEAWPNICQAMRGKKFHALADVWPPQSFGKDTSTITRFRFDLDPDFYWALELLRKTYGEPIARSKKMAAFELADGRQIAIDLEASKAQLWLEGRIPDLYRSDIEVKPYVANAPRHSNLPGRLKHSGSNPRPVSLVTVLNADALEALLSQYAVSADLFDRTALERLRERFIAAFPDFEKTGHFSGQSSYHTQEDNYKRALIEEAKKYLKEDADDPTKLGGRLLDLLGNEGDLESNLLGWRMAAGLKRRRADHPGLLEKAATEISKSGDPIDGVIGFVETTWADAFANNATNPYSDSRTLPTLVAALTFPETAIALRTDRFNNLFEALFGERLFANLPLSKMELKRATSVAVQLFDTMQDDWGWAPRDLWDVQGFIWVTCAQKLQKMGGDLDPTPIWIVTARWGEEDGLPRFLERSNWSLQTNTGSASNQRVSEMKLGDRIVARDYFHQTQNLPFGANGRRVSAIRLRAIGTITEVSVNGLSVGAEWDELDVPRTWYFYTHTDPVWRVKDPGKSPSADRLRRFILNGEDQDYDWFLNDPFWRDRIFGVQTERSEMQMPPTNLILYGPPGTGKTYRTALEAVRLCDGSAKYPEDFEGRAALMQRYRELVEKERVAFVTFHQNFSYEDFVEGLRPSQIDEDGNAISTGFRLAPEPGIFRSIAERAQALQKEHTSGFSLTDRRVFKMSLGEVANAEDDYLFDEAIDAGYLHLGDDGGMDWSQEGFDTKKAMLEAYAKLHPEEPVLHPNHGLIDHPFTMRNRMRAGDIVIVTKGNLLFRAIAEITGEFYQVLRENDEYTMRRPVKWLWVDREGQSYDLINEKRFSQKTIYELSDGQIKADAIEGLVAGENDIEEAGQTKPFVLIIDEINRANISKVFGELITLIEPDKRLGMPNALKVRLPYSKREFGVPANLHIVGTMNTADRSIALLDTALRRRFRFEELAPDPELLETVDEIDLSAVLRTINSRVEYLLDRDHAIGHAFFMGEGGESRSAIDDTMRFKVIPLLQEYFFEDWSRIHAVLGDGFLTSTKLAPPPDLDERFAVEERKSWSIRNPFAADAYSTLLGKAKPANVNEMPGPTQ